MGCHQRCHPGASTSPRTRLIIFRPVSESSWPVGSSARRTEGSFTRARASATPCCLPPDSSSGRFSARADSPTWLSTSATRLKGPEADVRRRCRIEPGFQPCVGHRLRQQRTHRNEDRSHHQDDGCSRGNKRADGEGPKAPTDVAGPAHRTAPAGCDIDPRHAANDQGRTNSTTAPEPGPDARTSQLARVQRVSVHPPLSNYLEWRAVTERDRRLGRR